LKRLYSSLVHFFQAYESQCQKIGQLTSEVEASKKDKITECSKLKEQISGLEKKMTEKNKEMDAFMKVLNLFIWNFNKTFLKQVL
jgi:seryl-tRNA synthetase